MKKRVLSLFLAIALCLTLTPTGALAAEGQPPEQAVSVTQEAQIPAPAPEEKEKEEEKTTPAENGAGENASPANPEENPTENAPAAAEKNPADEEPGKEPAAATGKDESKADGSPSDDDSAKVQNQLVMAAAAGPGEPTMMGQNNLLALADEGQTPANAQNSEGGGIYVPPGSTTEGGGGTYIPGEDTRTEIWCTSKPDSIGRGYDGTTDGGTIPIDLTFTDGINEIEFKEGTDFSAVKTFDSADAGWHTVTVEITLIGEAAAKYKLKAGEEKFEIGGNINKAYPDLTVSLSRATCAVGEKLLPLLSVEGAPKDAEVTYYYLASAYKSWAGSSDVEGSEVMPKIDANTAISEPGTYYVYAKTGETTNYKEERSATVELTVNEAVVEAASVTHADGTDGGTYESLPAALNAAQDGDTVKLLANHVTDADVLNALGENFTFEQYVSIVPVVTKTLTLDLNHKTVDYLEVGFTETNEETQKKETLATGNLTVTGEAAYGRISNLLFMAGTLDIRSGEIGGSGCSGLTCDANSGSVTVSNGTVYRLTVLEGATVNVNGGSKHAGEWVVSSGATLNITDGTFGEVQFTHNGTITISGGTFKSIKSYIAEELQPLMSLLDTQKVHAFYKGDDVQDGNATELADVTVKEHTHTPDENGKCACGASCVASVTSDAQSTNYTSLDDALNAAQNGDTVTLLSDVDLGETYVTISKNITFDLGGKTLSSSEAWLHYGVLLVKDATVTVKNGTVKAAGDGSCAIQAYRSGAIMTLEDVTATVTSDKSSVTVGDFGSAVIKSGDYQGLYVGAKSQVTLEGGTFRPYMDNITNKNVKSIFWKVNETTDDTSRDCMELLGDGCVYVDENGTQVRTGGGFNAVVTVQKGTAIDAPVAKIGDVEYASLSKAIDAVQNGETIALLGDLDLGNGAVLQVGSSKKNFTIDLDNHTLSADGACLIMLHNGSQLTLKNGTLDGSRCTSYEGVLYISSNSGPKLTLENVTAKSGSVADSLNVQRSVLLAYVAYGTVVFDGGTYTGGVLLETDGNAVLKSGTFQKGTNDYSIKTEDSGKHLSDYLDESLFWNGDTVLDLSSETQTADEVTVRPCEHNWENGKCTVCQKVCNHGSADGKSMTEDPCHTCGMKAAAQVDITGSATKYFPSFTDALAYANQNSGCTLKLLADVTETTVMISNPFLFDLNGHNVEALSVDAKATIKDSGTEKGKIGKVTVSNNKVTDLTLGGLLEEGYAFKYGNGYWANDSYLQTTEGSFVTVEKAPIQSVNVYAKDKNNQEILTIAYGATGEVTLVSRCELSETSGENLSCAWYKLTDDAAIPPLEGATGTSYKLPADLPAGTHTYLVTFTSDYYSKSAEITITVTPISLEGAEVTVSNLTYNGNPQKPTVTVKLGDETLSRDNDYTVQVTKQTDAGSYKLTISGNGNYSGKIEDVEWKIEPMKIDHVMVSSDISKTYDGTATVTKTAEEWAKILTFKTHSAYDVVSVPSDAYTISDAYFVEKSGEETVHSPDAGEKYGITFKITLKSSNYVLQNYYDKEPAAAKEYTQSGGATFAIAQAAAPTDIQTGALNVINGTKLKYTYDAKQLLPDAPKGTYGNVSYNCRFPFNLKNGYCVDDIAIDDSVLTLTIAALSGRETGKIGTIPIYITTDNYESFDLPLDLYAVDKITPVVDGDITASNITYSDELSKSTISGKMKNPTTGDEVKGTFAWTDGTIKPAANDNYEAEWTFTPDAPEYATVTGKATIKVKPAKLTVSVKASRMYYTGEAQIASIIASGQSVDSTPVTFTYSDKVDGNYTSGGPTFTDAGTYTAYYKAEAANHEPATGTFTVTIDPLQISLLSVSSISKTYDGSADVTLTTDKLTFFSKTAKATNIKLPDTALSFSNAQFTKQQADGSYLPSPEVGNGKALSFTMTLTSNNYVFEGKSEGTTAVSDVFVTDDANRFTITKAAAPTNIQSGTLNIINGTHQTYTYDFTELLPELSEGEYGTISYGNQAAISLVPQRGYYYDETIVEFKKGKLTLAQFYAKDGEMTGQIGTVKVKVTTTNYEDFQLTLVLNAVNQIKPTPDGKITASNITYGQALSDSSITGKMKDPTTGNAVNGTFAWKDGTIKPAANDSYEAEWTFTPDAPEYATVTGKATIKVNKATPAFTAPTAQENLTYTGQEQALITAGMTDYGTMQYSLTENGTYSQNIPTGTDAGTYYVWYRVIGDANHNDTKPASVAVRIGQKPLTITGVTAAPKTYDGTTNADISSVTFDNVTLKRDTDYTVTASFDDASVGSGKNVTATVTLVDQSAKNYALEQSSFTVTGSITKAAAPTVQPVELTIYNGLHKTYSIDLSTLLPKLTAPCDYGTITYDKRVYTNLGVGSFITLVNGKTGELTLEANRSGTDEGQFGTITVTISTSNYQDITLTVKVSAVNQITPVPEDGKITASKITYGQALSDSSITGKMKDPNTGATVTGTFTWDTPAVNPNAGSHDAKWTFTPDKSYGGKYTTYTDTAPVTINPKAVTVSGITAKDKVYDGKTNATLDCSNAKLDGVLENDTLTVTATGTFESANAGEQKVKISGFKLGGDSAANYVPSTVHSQTETTATITAKEVTVTITPNGGTYGSVTAAAAVLSGVVDGETVPVTLTYTGNGYNSTSVPTDVDSYTVTASIADSNYILTGETTANFVITPKTVIVSGITAKDKAYDGTTNATLDFSNAKFDGILENDKLTVTAKGVFEKTEAGKRNVAISDLTLGGDSAANYVLAESGNQTETKATITAKEVTVAITPNGGTYGSVTAAAAVLSGVVDGETVPVTLTYTGNGYNSTSVPTDVDSYTVTASIADSNYILTGETTANFVITPKTVIVSGITAKDKAYDGTTNATLDFSNAKFDGILENDKLTVTAKGVFEKTEAGKRNVAISDLTLGGNSVANYVLAESGNQTETKATITAKEVTVAITPNGGTYGSVTAAAAVLSGVVDGETVPVTLTYTGTANDGTAYADTTPPAKAGTYTVTATTTNPNYTLDPDTNTAEFAIAKRPATVTPDKKTKVYEEKDPDLTYTVRGVLDGETLKGITLTRAEGENAGEYAITATADAGANPNYDVTFAEGKFTINPKSIDGAKVVLGKALTANGAEQTQTVEKVLLGDKEIPADSYTVAGNTATAPGRYTLTVTAKGNYTGTVEQTYVIIPAKAEGAPGEEIVISSGKVKVVVKSEGAVPPATLLTDKAELLAMLVDSGDITADELAQIADGASVDIALTVKEANVSDEVKAAMAQAAKGYTIGHYLDISLFKYMTVNGSQQAGVPLHTTRDALTISVVVPDALINTNSAVNRTYCIVRRHDGAITVLDAAFDAASKTLTFKTDRFSDYAIAYKDTAVPSSGSNPGSNNSSNDSEAKKNEVATPTPAPTPASSSKPSTITAMPQTGDTSNPTLYVVLLVASLLGLAVVFVCKKRNDK